MIIFINGSINSGKSTVGKLLAQKIPKCAFLEIDTLRAMIDWMPLEHAIPINLMNAISVIKNFSKRGLSVIVPYPLSQKNYEYMLKHLKDISTSIKVFTLAPTLESALKNRGNRELSEAEKERIKYHYEIGIPNPKFGVIINNSNQTPEETTSHILKSINI